MKIDEDKRDTWWLSPGYDMIKKDLMFYSKVIIDRVCVSVFTLGPNEIRVQPTSCMIGRSRPKILCAWFTVA